MSTWTWVAVVVGLVLIVVIFVVSRPRTAESVLDRPARQATRKAAASGSQLTSGSLLQTPLMTLLVGLQASRATGMLTVTHSDQACSLYILFGHLFHATCGGLEGEKALQEALSWSDGTYSFDKKSSLPTAETVTRTLDEILAGSESLPMPLSSTGAEHTVDWTELRRRLELLADAALPERSRKVKELLKATPGNRDSYIETIDRIANMPILFVDPARLTTLAGKMRRTLDQESD
jgi:hypothetical protein